MPDHHHIKEKGLFEVLPMLENKEEVKKFFSDLCTPAEIKALKERWRVAQYLDGNKLSYREIHQVTGASLTTIGRVARFLRDEPYKGYKKLLEKIKLPEET